MIVKQTSLHKIDKSHAWGLKNEFKLFFSYLNTINGAEMNEIHAWFQNYSNQIISWKMIVMGWFIPKRSLDVYDRVWLSQVYTK